MADATSGQKRLMVGLFVFAILMTILGIVVIVVLSGL
jgi:uncharacterized membrane protein